MSKETYFFSHDYNARADRKLVKLIMKHGMTGVGIYWCIVEMLYEEGGYLPMEYERITFELRSKENVIQSVINDFDLFENDELRFWSNSVLERLQKRCDKSEKARESINKRWNNPDKNTNVLQSNEERNTIKERKEEERIENERIKDEFLKFWSLYPVKVGKSVCEKKWNKLTIKEKEQIFNTIETFKSYKPFSTYNHPNPETYLNQKRWNDEINIVSQNTEIPTVYQKGPR